MHDARARLSVLGSKDAATGAVTLIQRFGGAASTSYRIAMGPRTGRKVLTLVGGAKLPQLHDCGPLDALCANKQGFSLRAGVHCEANDRKGIEQLGRYIARPAISNERLSENKAGQVVLKLKTVYRSGATHVVLTPIEFKQHLAALIPRPRLHLIRFHSVSVCSR